MVTWGLWPVVASRADSSACQKRGKRGGFWRRLLLWMLAILVGGAVVAVVLDHLFPPSLARLNDASVTVVDHDGVPLKIFANSIGAWRLPTVVEAVPSTYLALLLAYEDRRFYQHGGIDGQAVLRAIVQNIAAGRVVSGASTLTMQVARLLEPHRRSFPNKLLEMVRALQLEVRYDKRTILGMYLTLAPFGGPVEGVRAAAWTWFGLSPRALSPGEAAVLVALPREPGRLRPDRFPQAAALARSKVLERGVVAGVIDLQTANDAAAEPIPTRMLPFPALAPHLAQALRGRHPGQAVVASSLDGGLQRQLEAVVAREVPTLVDHAGLAILVVDNQDRRVLGYVGAPQAHEDSRNGWIDMVRAARSPGSALKPFIYGLGFDDRVIHPKTIVADVSTRFGNYAPANFDRAFHGEMTIREALQQSLNVPAVLVLDRVGPARFAERLRAAGATLHFPRGIVEPSLPLALGGVSISLWDLTTLYVGLARGGEVAPLRVEPVIMPGKSQAVPVALLSPTAAAQIRTILEGTPPPSGVVPAEAVSRRSPIALKTGTSYGFRDAWAFGIGHRHTVGVWVGRPDGTPSPDHYGRNTAAPLLFRVFDVLDEGDGSDGRANAGTIIGQDSGQPGTPPALLRRIEAGDPAQRPLSLSDPEQLRLVFPTSGIALDRDEDTDGNPTPLAFSASGGRRPLTWLVNGQRIAITETRRDVQWRPESPGFFRVTVIDADGRNASANFEIR